MRAVCWEGTGKIQVETVPDPVIRNPRDAIIKVMYRTFRDKQEACIKVVMKPGATSSPHTESPASRQQ